MGSDDSKQFAPQCVPAQEGWNPGNWSSLHNLETTQQDRLSFSGQAFYLSFLWLVWLMCDNLSSLTAYMFGQGRIYHIPTISETVRDFRVPHFPVLSSNPTEWDGVPLLGTF